MPGWDVGSGPPWGHPSQQVPPAFSLSPGRDNGRKLFPALPLLQAAALLALTSPPSPLQRNSSKLNVPGQLLGTFLSHSSFLETHRKFILYALDDRNCMEIHGKQIRFDSRTNHIWERQRKRSWRTVLSLRRAQFLSFSENKNNFRILRTFSR